MDNQNHKLIPADPVLKLAITSLLVDICQHLLEAKKSKLFDQNNNSIETEKDFAKQT